MARVLLEKKNKKRGSVEWVIAVFFVFLTFDSRGNRDPRIGSASSASKTKKNPLPHTHNSALIKHRFTRLAAAIEP
jgi:hypothetical protein